MQADQAACGGFTGMINLSLTDLIQMVCLSRSDIVIRVKSEASVGVICIKKGQVLHAETNTLHGELAFLEILRWKDGVFEIQSSDSVSSYSIDKPWEHLLLEAMREHDEKGGGGGTDPRDDSLETAQQKPIPLLGAENEAAMVDIGVDLWEETEAGETALGTLCEAPWSSVRPTRVLIVDDSSFFTRQLSKMLEKDGNIQVVGTAKNGREALDFLSNSPEVDVITLDIQMPVMQGDTALKHIMIRHAIPVLMVSSVDPNQLGKVFDFLQLGALDFVAKPALHEDLGQYGESLRSLVKGVGSADLKNFKRWRKSDTDSMRQAVAPAVQEDRVLMLIGAEGAHMEWFRLPLKRLCNHGAVLGLQKLSRIMLPGFAQLIGRAAETPVIPIEGITPISAGNLYLGDGSGRLGIAMGMESALQVEEEESSAGLAWIDAAALSIENLAVYLGSRLSVYFLSGIQPIGEDLLNTLASCGCRVILPSSPTIVCRQMLASVEKYCQMHSIAFESATYQNLTEVWTKYGSQA